MPIDPEKLRARREAQGLSQRDLAALTGIHYATICDIERGRKADAMLSMVERLASALRCRSVSSLLRH